MDFLKSTRAILAFLSCVFAMTARASEFIDLNGRTIESDYSTIAVTKTEGLTTVVGKSLILMDLRQGLVINLNCISPFAGRTYMEAEIRRRDGVLVARAYKNMFIADCQQIAKDVVDKSDNLKFTFGPLELSNFHPMEVNKRN